MDELREGDALIVSELSRLGRSMLECMEILSIAAAARTRVYAIKGAWWLDETIQSKIIAMAFSMAAEIKRDLILARTTQALRARKAAGLPLGRPKGPRKSKFDPYRPEIEAILRRFTRKNVQHPTYKAFAELGKAVKTIFLCRYLSSKALRREIHEGLNVVEQWNGATDFVFFARRGEMASNRREDHEISMLSLHLIQNCMVYINTLMIQKVLARPRWQQAMTPRDYAALTPLIWSHVNPYGRFDLDMNARMALA